MKLLYSEDTSTIVSMHSVDGETVSLVTPVKIVPQVETWLSDLTDQMKLTLQDLVVKCVQEHRKGKFLLGRLCSSVEELKIHILSKIHAIVLISIYLE